jgi:copper homeostasis protein
MSLEEAKMSDRVTPPIILEVCVDTPDGLAAAVAGGADRIELCSALSLQGLTPSPGLMALAAAAPIPVYAMLRPRHGDFVYDAHELDAIRHDIDAARAAGLAGVAIGANTASGALDAEGLALLVKHAAGLGLTLHKAFDLVPDPAAALELAVELGFERILTSGRAHSVMAGLETLADLVALAGDRISILPGGGVRPDNVADLVARTGVREVHGSFGAPATRGLAGGHDGLAYKLGFVPDGLRETSREAVAAAVAALRRL